MGLDTNQQALKTTLDSRVANSFHAIWGNRTGGHVVSVCNNQETHGWNSTNNVGLDSNEVSLKEGWVSDMSPYSAIWGDSMQSKVAGVLDAVKAEYQAPP